MLTEREQMAIQLQSAYNEIEGAIQRIQGSSGIFRKDSIPSKIYDLASMKGKLFDMIQETECKIYPSANRSVIAEIDTSSKDGMFKQAQTGWYSTNDA
jgi:hypothetical protein